MKFSITAARQGDISENHAVAKVVMISTALSFVILAILAFAWMPQGNL